MVKKSPPTYVSRSRGISTSRGTGRAMCDSSESRITREGRSVIVTEYELDPRDIHDMLHGREFAPRPPIRVKYYKLTRTQHYAALGPLYGVARKPGQSLRGYAREVERVVLAALARNENPEKK